MAKKDKAQRTLGKTKQLKFRIKNTGMPKHEEQRITGKINKLKRKIMI